jgi:hypothetical protein
MYLFHLHFIYLQAFLNRFVRQNIAEIDEIPSEEIMKRVHLTPAEHALYMELEHHLRSVGIPLLFLSPFLSYPPSPSLLLFFSSYLLLFFSSSLLLFFSSSNLLFFASSLLRFFASSILRFFDSSILWNLICEWEK